MRSVFYMMARPDSIASYLAHANQIDILIPSVYTADDQGNVRGAVPPEVLDAARRSHAPVMPIIVNPSFKQETVHAMLANPVARARCAKALLEECRRHNYYGSQLDFENIPVSDREPHNELVRDIAALFAPGGFKLSIAVMYQFPGQSERGGYAQWIHDNWMGAYDLPELAKHVEFLSVMTYDHHTERTPPGPIAGFWWVREAIDYCLTLAPKEKLSLGIPLYGRRWHAGTRAGDGRMFTASVNAPEAVQLAAEMKATPQWDEVERAPWFWFYRDRLREYVFYNDARSFRERYELARQLELHGFSAWVLGAEDPAIWKDLPPARR